MSRKERTPEDRERDRLEREARRAAREGRPPPAALPPSETPPPPLGFRPARELDPAPARGDRSNRPEEAVPNGLYEPPPTAPRPPAMPPPFQPAARPAPVESSRGYAVHRASGRRTAAPDVLRGDRLGRGRGRGRRILPLLALATIGLLAIWFLLSLYQPFGGDGNGQVRVMIPQGSGVGAIADVLADRGVISSPFFFKARARVSGRGGDLKAGTFRLRKDMSYAAVLDALTQGAPPDVVRVTISEGRAREEVKAIVADQLEGDYLDVTKRSPLLDPRRYGAKRAADLEGFLFPATYDIKRRGTVRDLVDQQLRTFKREFAKIDMRAARRRKLSAYKVLIVASMVEREARLALERPIIASTIYNRLRVGLPLGIDATVRFAVGNWSRPLKRSELEVDSPYNTRQRLGLPPGPIGSPGLASIRAAANPAATKFLYFVVKPGTCGEHAFSRTEAEFGRDEARYNQARARRGGRSPTRC